MSTQEITKQITDLKEQLNTIDGMETEVYARIVGYYRPITNWNKGKKDEYSQRLHFSGDNNV